MANDDREYFRDLSDWVPAAPPVNEYAKMFDSYVEALPDVDFTRLKEPKAAPEYDKGLEFYDVTEMPSEYEHEDIDLKIDGDLWDRYDKIYEYYAGEDIDDTYEGGK